MPDPLADYRSGSCEPWTVNVMCSILRATQPRILLETGTYQGMTTKALALTMPEDAILYTLDNYSSEGIVPDVVLQNNQVKVINTDAIEWIKSYTGPPIEFAFIDDCHEAHHVYNELTELKPKMAPNSLICVHDVYGAFNLRAVVRAHGGFNLKLPLLHAGGGLGMIQL